MIEPEQLLDIAEAAAFLNVSETSLRRWTNSGELPCLRIGRRRERRFRRADLVAFMEHNPGSVSADTGGATASSDEADAPSRLLHTHVCGLYASDLGRVQLAVRFLTDALRDGGVAYLVAPKRLREPVVKQLEVLNGSLKSAIRERRFVQGDYTKGVGAQLEYWDERLRAATRAGAPSIRVAADVTEFALRIGDDVLEYEADYDRYIARQFPLATLCQYDVRKISGRDVFEMLKRHPDSFSHPVERWLA